MNKIFIKKFNIFIIIHLENIFIYINNKKNNYVKNIRWMFEQLKKFFFIFSPEKVLILLEKSLIF